MRGPSYLRTALLSPGANHGVSAAMGDGLFVAMIPIGSQGLTK